MKAGWKTWRNAFRVAWTNLFNLIIANLLWLVACLPIVTIGPATLTTYWWTARTMRDDKWESYPTFFRMFLRLFWRGIVWSVGWVAVLYLAYTNLIVYGHFLPPLGAAVLQVFWIYALLFLLAMQPYLLELLVMDALPWAEALKRSAWQVMANPIYSHMHLLILGVIGYAALKTTTVLFTALVALVLVFWAVIGADVPWRYGEERPIERNIEDVL